MTRCKDWVPERVIPAMLLPFHAAPTVLAAEQERRRRRVAEAGLTLRTRLTEKLGIRHPVLQAPMGGSAGGALAAAVSAAGGLGLIGAGRGQVLGAGGLDPEFAAAGNQRVGCGFITWGLAERPELLDVSRIVAEAEAVGASTDRGR